MQLCETKKSRIEQFWIRIDACSYLSDGLGVLRILRKKIITYELKQNLNNGDIAREIPRTIEEISFTNSNKPDRSYANFFLKFSFK